MPNQQVPYSRKNAGFTLTELMVVVLIGLILTTLALPNMLTVIATARLRGNISSLSGIFQNTRMIAVKNNRTMTARFTTSASTGIIAYAKLATDTSGPIRTDPQVQLEAPIVGYTTPTGTSAPDAITSTVLGFTPETGDASFNARGLPCAYSGGTCANKGFIYYFRDTRRTGSSGWAAVSISPAGRVKRWYWTGSTWSD